ncbi:MAG: peptidylprolyl isomerase [Actinobacteria bacterium]|nr:peptidylprolyl isomerase [Actinomycetota bacterium]
MTISRLLLLPALLLALLVAGCGGGDDDVPADAVAVVDGREIPRSDFDALLEQAKKSYKTQQRDFPAAGSEEYQTLRNQAVQNLVQLVELEQAAEDMGLEVTDKDVDARLEQIKKQYYGGDQKKLDEQLKKQNLTLEQVREDLRGQIVSEKIFNDVTKDVTVTDAQVKEFYETNGAQYRQPESREVRHILLKTKAEAEQVRAQLKPNGSNFAALARKHTEDTGSRSTGGKLTISRGQTVAPFDKVAFSLERNEISGLVKTEFGFHIIQAVSDAKKATTTPLKDVQDSIRQQLLQTKKNEAMTKWVEDLKADYEDKVAYAVGFTPPPAATGTTGSTTTEQ